MNFWDHLKPEDIELVHSIAKSSKVKEGELLAREGDKADSFFIVIDGELSISTHIPRKGAKILETLGPGEMVGWSWLLKTQRWTFDVRAHKNSTVLKVPSAAIFKVMEKDARFQSSLQLSVIEVLSSRLKNTRVLLNDLYESSHKEL